jgi:hypothetical protein
MIGFKVHVQKPMDGRVLAFLYFLDRAQGQHFALKEHGDAVSHAEGQVSVMRHKNRGDVNAAG